MTPDSHLTEEEKLDKEKINWPDYAQAVTHFRFVKLCHWDEEQILRQREPWLRDQASCFLADDRSQSRLYDTKFAPKPEPQEDDAFAGLSLQQIRDQYGYPDDMDDETLAEMIGRA